MNAKPPVSNEVIERPFTAVSLRGNIEAVMVQGERSSYALTASGDALKNVNSYVEHGTLVIESVPDDDNDKVKANITVADIDKISTSGLCHLIVSGALKANRLEILTSGISEVGLHDLAVKDELSMTSSGQGSIALKGKTEASTVALRSGGQSSMNMGHVVCTDIEAGCSGQASIELASLECVGLKAKTSGQSDIEAQMIQALSVSLATSGQSDISFAAGTINTITDRRSSGQSDIDLGSVKVGER